MKIIIGPLGRSGVSVTSGAQVNLLENSTITAGALTNAISVQGANVYSLVVTTSHEITVRIYKAAGSNAGLRAAFSQVVAAGDSFTYEFTGNSMQHIAVTGIATSTTATVSADFVAKVYP